MKAKKISKIIPIIGLQWGDEGKGKGVARTASRLSSNDFKGAILNAFIEVVDQVKTKTGRRKDKNGRDLDGDDLMNKIFGCDGDQVPKIKFNSLVGGLDKAEQRGLMYLYKGVVGVRDRKAHINFIQNDPLKTI
ncbi:MAG: TIGR02391 family protein [Candidatus Paceibacterota bacterium]